MAEYTAKNTKSDFDKSNRRITGLQKKLSGRDDILEETKKTLNETKKLNQLLLDRINQRSSTSFEGLSSREEAIEQFQEVLDKLRIENETLQTRDAPSFQRLTARSEPVQIAVDDLQDAAELIIELEDELFKLQESIAASDKESNERDNEIAQFSTRHQELRTILLQKDDIIKDLNSQLDHAAEIEKEIENIRLKHEEQSDTIAGLKAKLSQLDKQLQQKNQVLYEHQRVAHEFEGNDGLLDELVEHLAKLARKSIDPGVLSAKDKSQVLRDLLSELEDPNAISGHHAEYHSDGYYERKVPCTLR